MRALVIVNVQNHVLPGGYLPIPDCDAIISLLNVFIPRYSPAAATQDWHLPGRLRFTLSHAEYQTFETTEMDGSKQVLWSDHCERDSPGAQFALTLCLNCATAIFRKGTDHQVDSYSGFFDNQCRHRTQLDAWLRAMNVNEVLVVGLAAGICVPHTAPDALDMGYFTVIAPDETRAASNEAVNKTAIELENSASRLPRVRRFS